VVNANVAQNKQAKPLRLSVLVSGQGTNLQAILDAIEDGRLNAEIAVVICNHAGVRAITRAEQAGVPCEVYEVKGYPSRYEQQRAIFGRLVEANADLVVCAGWDRVLLPEIVDYYAGRLINVHPSLLPAFGGGLHSVQDALDYGVKITGCTVHFVTNDLDAGPIISQVAVPVLPGDTNETLSERIHTEEYRLLVKAIHLFGEGRLRVSGRKVTISDSVNQDKSNQGDTETQRREPGAPGGSR
jgi:phosphoribosylglycinamide formyltransferase-1